MKNTIKDMMVKVENRFRDILILYKDCEVTIMSLRDEQEV